MVHNSYHFFSAACSCKAEGSISLQCDQILGKCPCKENVTGDKCEQCKEKHYNYPYCYPCGCDAEGSESEQCDEYGKCFCRPNVVGDKCDKCADGYATFPDCDQCAALYYEEPGKHMKINHVHFIKETNIYYRVLHISAKCK